MQINNALWVKMWALGLSLALVMAVLLAVSINPFEVALIYLAGLAVVTGIGLMSNVWGGATASILAVFGMVLFNQFSGIYPRENLVINIAAELVTFLLVGPLAGRLGGLLEQIHRQARHWQERATERAVHRPDGSLKLAWATARLDEEILRAVSFKRPLSVVAVQIAPHANAGTSPEHAEAARDAVLRLARSATKPPSVITRDDAGRILLILPEHTRDDAGKLAREVIRLAGRTRYFPGGGESLGVSLTQWGRVQTGIAALNGHAETGDSLLKRAEIALLEGEPHV